MDNHAEITETLLRNRCALLQLFRCAFAQEPDGAFVAALAGGDAANTVDLIATDANGLENLVSFLRSLPRDESVDAFVDDARAEYTKLFIGPGKAIAPFWESVYLDPRELLFTESTADVRKRYESEGYRVATAAHEAEDSITLQLDFLANLAQRTLQAFVDGDDDEYARLLDVQLSFERDHMLDWLPLFAERAQSVPSAHLYPALCNGVAHVMATDAELLEELIEMAPARLA